MRYMLSCLPVRICILFWSLWLGGLSAAAQQGDPSPEPPSESTLSSLKKSLILPGWGQLAEKHYIEGALFLAAEAFSLYEIFSYNRKGNTYYQRYRDAQNIDDAVRFRDLTEDYDRKRNIFILTALGIWAVNLIDIYVIVRNKNKQKVKLQLKSVDQKGMVVSLRFSF
jgi:hypothetical protein